MRGGFKGRKPLSAGAVFPALAVSCRSRARFGAKASGQAKQKHRAPVRALRRLAVLRQRAAAGAVLRSGGGDQRAGADVLPRWHKAASRQKQRAQRLMSALLSAEQGRVLAPLLSCWLPLGRAAPGRSLQSAFGRPLRCPHPATELQDEDGGLEGGGNASGRAAE